MTDTLWGAVDGAGTQVVVIQHDGDNNMYVLSHDLELFTAPLEELTLTGKKYELKEAQ